MFCKQKCKHQYNFTVGTQPIDVVDTFSYLGVVFQFNNIFSAAKRTIVAHAKKAMYSVLSKISYLKLPVDLLLELFDSLVSPVLLYSCEIWGFENLNLIEGVHLDFCKPLLKLRKSTPNYMVYGELGRFPMYLRIYQRMYNFWCTLVQPKTDKLSSFIYRIMLSLYQSSNIKSPWLQYIEKMLNQSGHWFLWNIQFIFYVS